MAHPKVSYQRAKAISTALLLFGLAILLYLKNYWWPGLLPVIGFSLAARHFLLGRMYDMVLTLIIFVGGFIAAECDIRWDLLAPALLTIAGIYLLAREFLDPNITSESEDEESIAREIDESKIDESK